MKEENSGRADSGDSQAGWSRLSGLPSDSASTLTSKIGDQQIYLCLTSTLLRLAKEAGASEDALKQVGTSLLAARGLNAPNMLAPVNQSQQPIQSSKHTYEWLDRGCPEKDQMALLSKVETEILHAREKENLYHCLVKYKTQKSEEMAPINLGGPNSHKERFKRMAKAKIGRKVVESSDFYRFDIENILRNSYRYDNECYRTVACFSHLKTMFGHTAEPDMQTYSQIFNAIMDRDQKLIISGGQEGLIKIWHRESGSLIANLKGHNQFLNKLDTSSCNKYLLSSAGDGLRFFDLKQLKPLGGWKTSAIAEVSSLMYEGRNYFLFGDNSYLYVLSQEIMLAKAHTRLSPEDFYQFNFGEITECQNSCIIVISFGPSKTHLLLGLQSGQMLMVLVQQLMEAVYMNKVGEQLTLPCLMPVKAHAEQIIEVKWSNMSTLWATGAKDGRCCLWELNQNRMQLLKTLSVNSNKGRGRRKRHNYSCTYICWNCTYTHFAAGFQENIDEEDSDRGRGQVLVYSVKQEKVTSQLSRDVSQDYSGVRAMDAHPYFPNILLICQADGHILLFDIFVGCVINTFEERGYHILHPQFHLIPTECRFTKDGLSFLVATQYGTVSLYGYDNPYFYSGTPVQQFLKTDFEQTATEENTMRAIPLTLDSSDDINQQPRGELMSVRNSPHSHTVKIDNPQQLLRAIFFKGNPAQHLPQISVDQEFLKVVLYNIREKEAQEISYGKTYQDVERMKELVLFHQRQRQYMKFSNLISQKLKALRPQQSERDSKLSLSEDKAHGMASERPVRRRTLERHSERERVSYVDDFQYDDSQEEDYNAESFIEQELPEDIEEEEYSQDDDEDGPPRRRRPTRPTRMTRRQTRSNNNPRYMADVQEEQPEVMTRRRRRDLSEEYLQLQSEQLPRKRQKMQEEESQHKPFSRLKKQVQVQQMGQQERSQCYRCQVAQATVNCHNCPYTQQFCEQCSKMRGKRVRDRFNCLICLFLKNSAEQDYENVTQDDYRATRRSEEEYLPQIGDKVRLFFQGYEEFLVQNIAKLNNALCRNNQQFRLLPHTEDGTIVNTPLCSVASIEYYFPLKSDNSHQAKRNPGKGEKTPILMVVGLKPIEDGQMFWVYFWPGQEYLLKEEIYRQVQEKDMALKLSVNDLVSIQDEQMQIVETGPYENAFPETVWKMIKVRKTQGKRLRGNTKDIEKRVNVWKLAKDMFHDSVFSGVDLKQVQGLMEQIKEWTKQEDSSFCIFIDYVDFDIYPVYRKQVPVGMCLQTILARLENNYYVSYQSLDHDIGLILDNSLRFNGVNHPVTKSAETLVSLMRTFLKDKLPEQSQHANNSMDNGTSQTGHHVKISTREAREDSSSKKRPAVIAQNIQALEEEYEQYVQDQDQDEQPEEKEEEIEEEEEIVTKRRVESEIAPVSTRRKRKLSSDYEEDNSQSPENMGYGVRTRKTRTRNGGYTEVKQPRRVTRSGTRT